MGNHRTRPGRRQARAFTLIELMMVAAILSVLSVLAGVAYMELSVRVKVVRARVDMRWIGLACERHEIDRGRMPEAHPAATLEQRLEALRQPVPYLGAVPPDPFGDAVEWSHGWSSRHRSYELVTDSRPYHGLLFTHPMGWGCRQNGQPGARYFVASQGPDEERNLRLPSAIWTAYDATNGAISRGDVLSFGPGYAF